MYYIEEGNPPNDRKAQAVCDQLKRWREGSRPMAHGIWVSTLELLREQISELIEDDLGDE